MHVPVWYAMSSASAVAQSSVTTLPMSGFGAELDQRGDLERLRLQYMTLLMNLSTLSTQRSLTWAVLDRC